MFRRVSPVSNVQGVLRKRAIQKYKKNKPSLNWEVTNNKGILYSGWNPLKGINICFVDRSATNDMMCIFIEVNVPIFKHGLSTTSQPNIPFLCNDIGDGSIAFGYFFEKDPVTRHINLMVRTKHFRETEHVVVYRNCQYFGLDYDDILVPESNRINSDMKHIIQSRFIVSNEWQDKTLRTGVNLLYRTFQDFQYVVEAVNDFIQDNMVKEHLVPGVVNAYPVLRVVRRLPDLFTPETVRMLLYQEEIIHRITPNAVAEYNDDVCEATVVVDSNG